MRLRLFSWCRDQSTDQSNSFFSSEVFASSSATYHQLYSIPQSLWPSENKSSSLIEVNDLNARKWTARNLKRVSMKGLNGIGNVLVVEPPKPLPKNSVLGAHEQKDYLFSILRVKKALMNGTPPDSNDLKVLKVGLLHHLHLIFFWLIIIPLFLILGHASGYQTRNARVPDTCPNHYAAKSKLLFIFRCRNWKICLWNVAGKYHISKTITI